jgi:hypothetical protein
MSAPDNPPRLFLSHSGVDTSAARELKRRLLDSAEAWAAGLMVWLDKDDLAAGAGWQSQLEKAINGSVNGNSPRLSCGFTLLRDRRPWNDKRGLSPFTPTPSHRCSAIRPRRPRSRATRSLILGIFHRHCEEPLRRSNPSRGVCGCGLLRLRSQ